MWKFLPVLLLASRFAFCGDAKELKSEDGAFSVDAPIAFEASVQDMPTAAGVLHAHMFSGENKSAGFLVMYFDVPAEQLKNAKPEDILAGGREGEISSMKGKKTSEKAIELDGAPGSEYSFTADSEGVSFKAKARVFLVGNRVYHLLVLDKDGTTKPEDVDKFLNSFKVLKK